MKHILLLILLMLNAISPANNHFFTKCQTLAFDADAENEIGWNLERIHIQGAWDISYGSSDIIVAIIDTGIDFTHPELVHAKYVNEEEISDNEIDDDNNGFVDDVSGWDFYDNDNSPTPILGHYYSDHASMIAGIIAAKKDDSGVVGIAPNVKIMSIRVYNEEEEEWADREDIAKAVKYAIDNGADLINWGYNDYKKYRKYYSAVVNYAYKKNIPIVTASGNRGNETTFWPGGFSEVIAVGATDMDNLLANFSCYGKHIELVAPGVNIKSTSIGEGYRASRGTSYSHPHVTGVIALMKSVDNSLSISKIRYLLHITAIDLGEEGKDEYFGYGLINASAAVLEVCNRLGSFWLLKNQRNWIIASSVITGGLIVIIVIRWKRS